jgi:hypothetical protein
MRAEDLPGALGTFRLISFAQSFHWMDRSRVASAVRGSSMPMAPLSKSTYGTPTRRARCPRTGHTHQYPRRPLMSCVGSGSVLTAVPVKGSGTPPPAGRTRCSKPPGSPPRKSW